MPADTVPADTVLPVTAVPPDTALTRDHAGSLVCRLLVFHPEVIDIRILGQTDMPGGIISYSLGVILPGGRELYIEVEDAPSVTAAPSASRADTPR